jgi:NADH:ubiquinone reductase (H+-translocating)
VGGCGIVRTRREAGVPDDQIRVTLINAGDDMVIRPRLYEPDPQQMRVPLDRVLGPIGVRRIAATATDIDTSGQTVSIIERDGTRRELSFDRLVLATGSRVVRPTIDGAEHLFDVDTMPSAAALHSHIHLLPTRPIETGTWTAVVVGAGFTGIEVATELTGRLSAIAGGHRVRVVLVDRASAVGPEYDEEPRAEILRALNETGVEVILNTTVASVSPSQVKLSDGTAIETATVVWTAGMRASDLTEQVPGERDTIGRLLVDEFLRVQGVPHMFAAGDTAAAVAEEGHFVTQSCQHAVPQGKFVGVNVASDLLGLPLVAFAPDPYVTCLDLGPAGAMLTTGWDRVIAQTGADAKTLKQNINAKWIYPTLDDADMILLHADHRTTWPTAALG